MDSEGLLLVSVVHASIAICSPSCFFFFWAGSKYKIERCCRSRRIFFDRSITTEKRGAGRGGKEFSQLGVTRPCDKFFHCFALPKNGLNFNHRLLDTGFVYCLSIKNRVIVSLFISNIFDNK